MSNEIPIHGTPEQVLAFCKAFRTMQPKIPAFPRTREGQEGNRKFNYTEYDKVLEIVEPIFDEHGFFHFQNRNTVEAANGPMATVDSFLLHELGGYSHAHNEARVESKNAIREAGKAHTYFSRYGLIGLIGKTSETDQDAPEAPPQQAQRARQEPAKQEPKAQPSGDKERAKKGQVAIEKHLKEAASGNPKTFADFASQVSAYSQDAHAGTVAELVEKGWDKKVEDVYLWAKKNIGPQKQVSGVAETWASVGEQRDRPGDDDEEHPGHPSNFGDQ